MAKLSSTQIYGDLQVDGEIKNKASTTSEGVVQLNDEINSTSTTQGATANAVKKVNDSLSSHASNTTSHVTASERTTWNGKASTSVATSSANGLMSSADKSKLDGIATNANNYTHPSTHDASMITESSTKRFVTDTEKSTWNGKANASHTHTKSQITDFPTSLPANGGTADSATYLNAISLSTEDLDEVKNFGTYYAPGSNSVVNRPSGVDAFGMQVLRSASGWYTQVLYASNNQEKVYVRYGSGSGWSEWDMLYSKRNKPTIDEIGGIGKQGTGEKAEIFNDTEYNVASGVCAHAEGSSCQATNTCAHAEGLASKATGNSSHAEGSGTEASGQASHAEGWATKALGLASHAEGDSTIAYNGTNHAEGFQCVAGLSTLTSDEHGAHAEGYKTTATGQGSHSEGMSTSATAMCAHAEGSGSIASGMYSHAEGASTTASGQGAHSEGYKTQATKNYAHAEGYSTQATSNYAHSEGYSTQATGTASHSEGYSSIAKGSYSHAEGETVSYGGYSHSEGGSGTISNSSNSSLAGTLTTAYNYYVGLTDSSKFNIAWGRMSHAEGYNAGAFGNYSHVEGYLNRAKGDGSHAEGANCIVEGTYAHVEGYRNTVTGYYAHAEGMDCVASDTCAHAEGSGAQATGYQSHAEGANTTASSYWTHAAGLRTTASGRCSSTNGVDTTSETYATYVIGSSNKVNSGSATSFASTNNAFVIGNGASSSARANAFRVDFSGRTYGLSAFNSTGADYAEYFEWEDGNPNNEDRIGHFVTLDGEKIRLANSEDDYIIGIISGNQSIIGNACEDGWNDMYLRDEFGRLQYEDVEVEIEVNIINEETKEIEKNIEKTTEKHIKLNPNYDPNVEYKPRSERKEWGIVGMLGQIIVRDDGTCKVNGYCKPSENGIATASDNKAHYRVMSRISDNLIKVIMR